MNRTLLALNHAGLRGEWITNYDGKQVAITMGSHYGRMTLEDIAEVKS